MDLFSWGWPQTYILTYVCFVLESQLNTEQSVAASGYGMITVHTQQETWVLKNFRSFFCWVTHFELKNFQTIFPNWKMTASKWLEFSVIQNRKITLGHLSLDVKWLSVYMHWVLTNQKLGFCMCMCPCLQDFDLLNAGGNTEFLIMISLVANYIFPPEEHVLSKKIKPNKQPWWRGWPDFSHYLDTLPGRTLDTLPGPHCL